jgi:hypothetical protein
MLVIASLLKKYSVASGDATHTSEQPLYVYTNPCVSGNLIAFFANKSRVGVLEKRLFLMMN